MDGADRPLYQEVTVSDAEKQPFDLPNLAALFLGHLQDLDEGLANVSGTSTSWPKRRGGQRAGSAVAVSSRA